MKKKKITKKTEDAVAEPEIIEVKKGVFILLLLCYYYYIIVIIYYFFRK